MEVFWMGLEAHPFRRSGGDGDDSGRGGFG